MRRGNRPAHRYPNHLPRDVNSLAPGVIELAMQQVWSNEPNFVYWKCTTRVRLGTLAAT